MNGPVHPPTASGNYAQDARNLPVYILFVACWPDWRVFLGLFRIHPKALLPAESLRHAVIAPSSAVSSDK